MASPKGGPGDPGAALLEEAETGAPELSPVLEALLPAASRAAEAGRVEGLDHAAYAGVRTARLVRVAGRAATIALRGVAAPIEAAVAPEVDPALVRDALEDQQSVLVEVVPGEAPLVVGVVQTRAPRAIKLKAATVLIEGDEEVCIRSGRGAVRIRQDGDIELLGSRISAASRGLFRIVGRVLRLN